MVGCQIKPTMPAGLLGSIRPGPVPTYPAEHDTFAGTARTAAAGPATHLWHIRQIRDRISHAYSARYCDHCDLQLERGSTLRNRERAGSNNARLRIARYRRWM